MTVTQQIETLLIGTAPSVTGHERIVAAILDGDDLFIPLDAERAANQDLLKSSRIYVRNPESSDRCVSYSIRAREAITDADRNLLEAHVSQPLSATTDVLHASLFWPQPVSRQPRGFVCVVDGSDRAGKALGPAQALADWYEQPLAVCAIAEEETNEPGSHAASVHRQLDNAGISRSTVRWVNRQNLAAEVNTWVSGQCIVVCSAFGSWGDDGQLFGAVNELVSNDVPAVIGIGPNVPDHWAPADDQPIAIFVDDSEHAFDMVRSLEPVLPNNESPLTVVHITTEDPPDAEIAAAIADELRGRHKRPIEVKNINGRKPSEDIAAVASTLDAQIAVVLSWHRRTPGVPTVASASMISVAKAHCPVLILSRPEQATQAEH